MFESRDLGTTSFPILCCRPNPVRDIGKLLAFWPLRLSSAFPACGFFPSHPMGGRGVTTLDNAAEGFIGDTDVELGSTIPVDPGIPNV